MVCINHDDPILLASVWLRRGQDPNPGQRDMRAKSAGDFWERGLIFFKGDLLGKQRPSLPLFPIESRDRCVLV